MQNQIITGDCREESQNIEAGSVDLVVTDPPYGTVKGVADADDVTHGMSGKTAWDESLPPETLFKIANRILRVKGKLILFAQEPYTSELITSSHDNLPFSYRMEWVKDHYANCLQSKEAPVHMYEDILVFTKEYDTQNLHPLRKYSKQIFNYIGLSKSELIDCIGQEADHFFRYDSTQFALCTQETYKQLIKSFSIDMMDGFKPYRELELINSDYENVFNLPPGEKYKPNVLEYAKDYDGHHPTQKPVALLRDLIRTFSNESDYVVDLTAGSGSTGVACRQEDREFTGIEKKPKYAEIARDRIGQEIENPEVLRKSKSQKGLEAYE